MIYFGSKISPNLTRTDEGYLIALNVPIARTGIQKYLPAEVPVDDSEQYAGPDGLIPVYREPEEVFSPKTIASFEGKPVADNHPSTPDNKIHAEDIGLYGKGHMQNVRRGTGEEEDNLLADLVITDIPLSNVVESGDKREISCGYDCDWVVEDGKVYQKNITGNHVAVVPQGRAGSSVAIKDAKPKKNERGINLASKNFFKRALGMGLKEAIKDAEPEDVAELMHDPEKAEKSAGEPAKDADPTAPEGEGGALEKILATLKDLGGRVAALEESHAEPEKSAMDALNEETKEEAGEEKKPDDDKSETIDSSETTTDCDGAKSSAGDSAVIKDFVRQLKPQIAKIADKATRDSMAQTCLDALHGGAHPETNVYANISKAAQTHKAKAAQDNKPPMTIAEKNAAFVANMKKAAEESAKMGG